MDIGRLALNCPCTAGQGTAQSFSPEDIARMLDEQAAAPNPYAALLNDPDPTRSLGAMRIMMESDDPALVDLALEYDLPSSDPQVQRATVRELLDQEPILDELGTLRNLAVPGMDGTIETDGMAYGRWYIGEYSQNDECWLWRESSYCAIVDGPEGFS